ncbi:MAG: HD domain-containing protein [Oligoflexia bacterium]|nr:HD domain-containing protein [Oligoflexia bacterium]
MNLENKNQVESRSGKIILLEKDQVLVDLITFSLQSNFNFEIIDVSKVEDISHVLQDEQNVSLIILNYNYGNECLKFVSDILQNQQKKILLFLIASKADISKLAENPTTTEVISTADTLNELNQIMHKHFQRDQRSISSPFCSIAARTLIRFNGINDDVYVQLKTGRFLKLFSKKDLITLDDITHYARKGVTYLYLKSYTGKWILREINKNFQQNLTALSTGGKVQLDSSTRDNDFKEDAEKFKINPATQKILTVDKEFVEEINLAVNKSMTLIKKNPTLGAMLRKLRVNRDKKNYFNAHIGMLSNISCGIARLLGWSSEITLEKLVFACYTHDIALIDHPHLAQIANMKEFEQKYNELNEEERTTYLNHSKDAAELISTIPNISADIESIVLQHHEMPDGSGFPHKVESQRISPLSALFIITHDFVDYIFRNKEWYLDDYLELARKKYPFSTFKKILTTMEKMRDAQQ